MSARSGSWSYCTARDRPKRSACLDDTAGGDCGLARAVLFKPDEHDRPLFVPT